MDAADGRAARWVWVRWAVRLIGAEGAQRGTVARPCGPDCGLPNVWAPRGRDGPRGGPLRGVRVACRVSVVDRDVLTPAVRETRDSFLTARSAANQEYAVLDAGERRLWRPRGWPCATARRRAGQYLQLLFLNVILFAPRGPPSSTRSPRCEALRHDGPAYSPARPPPAVEARADSYATVWGRSPRGRRGQWQA